MQKIYEVMETADSAYILHKGKLIFEVSPQDRYSLEGSEIIFGAEEPLIAFKADLANYFRFQTVYIDAGSTYDRVPLKNLYNVMSNYNIGYSVTRNIAKYVNITNKIYINKEKKLSGKEMALKEYAIIYADVIEKLKTVHQKLKLTWVKDLSDRYSNSLVYARGLAFGKGSSRSDIKFHVDKLQEYTVDLNAGAILCEQGDLGNEMFILNRGYLEVYIGGKKVVDINESGAVIGEMALMLGEKRTATIKSVTDCNITVIKPEDLKQVAEKDKNFFLNLGATMGKRLEHNCNLIRETNDLLLDRTPSDMPAPPQEKTSYRELMALMAELENYEQKYKNDWLIALDNEMRRKVAKVRELGA